MTGYQSNYVDYLAAWMKDPHGKYAQFAGKQLVKLINSVKEKGIDFAIVLFPSFSGDLADVQKSRCFERKEDDSEAPFIYTLF